MKNKVLFWSLIALVIFGSLAGFLGFRLASNEDASVIPSVLIGKPVPAFSLPAIPGLDRPGFSDQDLRQGQISIVNVFASYCEPCQVEHPLLQELSESPELAALNVVLVGLAYEDKPEKTRDFLQQEGNPFKAVGSDLHGRVGIDWGLTGIPETYIVGPQGIILRKFVGRLKPEQIEKIILPLLRETRAREKKPVL